MRVILLVAAAALLAAAPSAQSKPTADGLHAVFHVGSFHTRSGYNNFNPGFGLMARKGVAYVAAGAYVNSFGDTSRYVTVGLQYPADSALRAGGGVGAVDGYHIAGRHGEFGPAAAFVVSYQKEAYGGHVLVAPPACNESKCAGVVHGMGSARIFRWSDIGF